MFTRLSFFKGKIYKLIRSVIPNTLHLLSTGSVRNLKRLLRYPFATCFASLAMTLLFVNGAHGDPIVQNQVEDLKIVISQFVGGEPNVLTILDLSGSMGRNHGGTQVGSWDGFTAFSRCEDSGTGNSDQRTRASHCAEEMAGTAVCGTQNCGEDGRCNDQSEFNNQVACVQAKAPTLIMAPIFTTLCGGPLASDCNNDTERTNAAAAIEAAGGLTQCSRAANCQLVGDPNPACNTSGDYTRFKTCMQTLQAITANKDAACTGGTPNPPFCQGIPQLGSSRIDMALDVFFSFLDADDSLATKDCADPTRLFDGTNTSINCQDFMETPFRNVNTQVIGTGNLPSTPAAALINELTNNDADILNVRFRPMSYSGVGRWNGCTDVGTFQISSNQFAGATGTDLQNVWTFYRGTQPNGGTPLAYSLGFSNTNSGTNTATSVGKNALFAYKTQLQTDPAISCRPEFVIVITDGEDTCSGQCSVNSGSCDGGATTNANRRSSVQAVSNLRTFYARNPVANSGNSFKKEVLTFVIGIGIRDDNAKRTLNAMALAGGTHTTGIIKHCDPGAPSSCDPDDPDPTPDEKKHILGSVNINDVLPSGSAFDPFRALGIAEGIFTNPPQATLRDCLVPIEDPGNTAPNTGTHCHIGAGDQSLFFNAFFNTGDPFTAADPLDGFAFFVDNAEQLAAALQDIIQFIQTFSTSGVAPAAPQSSTSVALRDRVFLSILSPITSERLWQGRLALYAFIDDPDNPGAKIIVDNTPQQNPIFNDDGTLNEFAKNFYWEAGKNLAERNLNSDPRNLFTVDITDTSAVDTETSGSNVIGIRYRGERAIFDNNLPPALFGISNADVTNPIPDFCTADCDPATTCSVVSNPGCQTCVKDCIRDRIVSFMGGNTDIQPVADPMGTIGTDCPDPETGGGSLATCSLRLGDIFHSTPRVVGSPSALFFDVGFQNFAVKFRDRTGVVYVGANDGFYRGFNAGDFVNASSANPQENPFTREDELVPFFSAGDGNELFAFAPPSFLPDSLSANGSAPSGFGPPDFRFGDFKTFVVNDFEPERSFSDGSPLVADVFIDGYTNGIQDDASICASGTITSPDGAIDPCGKEWHTVLLAGYRNGSGAYMALDVTNVDKTQTDLKKLSGGPDYPRHLWTVFDKNFGNSWSDPTIGRVQMKTKDEDGNDIIVDRWVMFVGGGLDPVDTDPTNGVTFGNAFYAIDIATGKVIFKLAKDTTSAPNATVTDSRMVCDNPSQVGAFDLNSDGFIDIVYDGDTCGRLWRYDVSMPIVDNDGDVTETGLRGDADITAPDWTGDIAFCANTAAECARVNNVPTNNRQPIFFAPTLVLDNSGRKHVIFVTGDRRDPSITTAGSGKLFNFIDDFIPAFFVGGTAVTTSMKTEGDFTSGEIINLVQQTGSGISDQFTTSGGTEVEGEFIVRFPNNVSTPSGEKGFGAPVVISRVLLFATFAPNTGTTNPCSESTGVGRIFALDYLSGEPALARVPGSQPLLQGSSSQKTLASGRTVAQGMPTPAQLTFGARGSVVLTVAFTGSATAGGSQFLVWELPPFPTRTQTLFWEEIF